jgi:23S rRNA maturation-related 3'-5' exoribonuclease YhaM
MPELVNYITKKGYFESPASIRFHGSYKGGLLNHCSCVFGVYNEFCKKYKLDVSEDSMIIICFLHDICKVGLYEGTYPMYTYNKALGARGHGKLSVERIEKFIKLTSFERDSILFHMGIYTREFGRDKLEDAFQDIRVKLFYFADEISGNLIEKEQK